MNNNKSSGRKTQLYPNTRLGTAKIIVPNQEKWTLDELPSIFPKPTMKPYKNVFAYSKYLYIDNSIIKDLSHLKLLYQAEAYNNMVFINISRDAAEIRGTNSFAKEPFVRVRGNIVGNYWYFQSAANPDAAYICSTAIDCLSLYQLLDLPAYYICPFGAYNQYAIDIIKEARIPNTILAVKNNTPGMACRERNRDLACICPIHETWNEDLRCKIL